MKNTILRELVSTLKIFGISFVAILTFYGIQAYAWTAPGGSAPAGNVAGPLTTGAGNQTKAAGSIMLGTGGSLLAGGYVAAPQLCIGSDCKTAWPTAGAAPSGTMCGAAEYNAYFGYWIYRAQCLGYNVVGGCPSGYTYTQISSYGLYGSTVVTCIKN